MYISVHIRICIHAYRRHSTAGGLHRPSRRSVHIRICIYLCIYVYVYIHTGGTALPVDYIDQVGDLCEKYNVKLHMDGARIFNAATAVIDYMLYIDLCIYVYTYIYVYIDLCIYVYIYRSMYICIYIYIWMCIYIYICLYRSMYIHIYMLYIDLCIYVYTYIYVCMYIYI